jgi:hypothetical protein
MFFDRDIASSTILLRYIANVLNDAFAVYRQLNAAELWPTETFAVYGQLNAADLSPAEV